MASNASNGAAGKQSLCRLGVTEGLENAAFERAECAAVVHTALPDIDIQIHAPFWHLVVERVEKMSAAVVALIEQQNALRLWQFVSAGAGEPVYCCVSRRRLA